MIGPVDRCEFTGSAADFVPKSRSLRVLAQAAQSCHGCPLYCRATQVVFGEGPKHATVMFVGEQPGNDEDLAGRPFVGPAGRVLNAAMEEAGIDRSNVYVTNAVKHFKWEQGRGKRRLHSKPSWTEVTACKPWLIAEINLIEPQAIVCLGATAAQSLLGKTFKLTQHRREATESELAAFVTATVHPSSILRMPDDRARRAAREAFTEDLRFVAKHIRARA